MSVESLQKIKKDIEERIDLKKRTIKMIEQNIIELQYTLIGLDHSIAYEMESDK